MCTMPSRVPARPLGPILLIAVLCAAGAGSATAQDPVFVDRDGVMRWTDTKAEVALFGVNYTTPFAHAYRAHLRLGVDHKAAIDADVAHIARLGFDAFRVHVWEREVADSVGNLLSNDHLDLYDYLVARLAERGIRTVLTPIAWWPTGYPEPATDTGSFIDPFTKAQLGTDPVAVAAQVRYFDQWVRHVNPYTGKAYKDDPAVIAMEFVNEPNHPGDPSVTTAYIDRLVASARAAGWKKPVFYNIAEGYTDAHGRAVCAAKVQGITMQWYPTALVRGRSLGGNMLPNVDRYPTPFDVFPECANKARLVYEFDAADVAGSYMYPVMTRSFRGAGVQFATQFAYDPLAMAPYNTEYQTHFVNLVHAPGKAISLMIAGEVFRRVPRRAAFPAYPEGSRFETTGSFALSGTGGAQAPRAGGARGAVTTTRVAGDGLAAFRVSYEEDLSEMVADTVYFHSNTTTTVPPDASKLRHVAGVGSSPVVSYAGTGAYFLDRVADGAWRLEVYPDAIWVEDPFTRTSLSRRNVEIVWAARPITVSLPDLGAAFQALAVNAPNAASLGVPGDVWPQAAADGRFTVSPGVWLLTRPGAPKPMVPADFFAPPTSVRAARLIHHPPAELEAGRGFEIAARLATPTEPDSVVVYFQGGGRGGWTRPVRLLSAGGPDFRATIAGRAPGLTEYRITVFAHGEALTFPGAVPGMPFDWDFTGQETWSVPVVEAAAPLVLFDGRRDRQRMLMPSFFAYVRFRSDFVPGRVAGDLAFRAEVPDFEAQPHLFAARAHLEGRPPARLAGFGPETVLRIVARSAGRDHDRVDVAITLADGSAWAATLDVTPEWRTFEVPVSSLKRTDLFLLPRPYPQFPPYRFQSSSSAEHPDLSRLDGVQFAVGRELFAPEEIPGAHGFEIERVILDPGQGAQSGPGGAETGRPGAAGSRPGPSPRPDSARTPRLP